MGVPACYPEHDQETVSPMSNFFIDTVDTVRHQTVLFKPSDGFLLPWPAILHRNGLASHITPQLGLHLFTTPRVLPYLDGVLGTAYTMTRK
jgi:hypothetical protein